MVNRQGKYHSKNNLPTEEKTDTDFIIEPGNTGITPPGTHKGMSDGRNHRPPPLFFSAGKRGYEKAGTLAGSGIRT
jgi:hypothetical protein